MNIKLFYTSIIITFGMLFWLFFQPTDSMNFIGLRIGIAFLFGILMILSFTWNAGKKAWKKTLLFLAAVLGIGAMFHFAFNIGIVYYPIATLCSMAAIVVACIAWIKYGEPKMRARDRARKMKAQEGCAFSRN